MKTTLNTYRGRAATKASFSGLKPQLFCGVYFVAKATSHKHSRVATQTLKLGLPKELNFYAWRDEFED